MFTAGIVFWVLLVIEEIFVVIRNLMTNAPFDLSFWGGPVMVVIIAAILIRAGRLRRSAPR